jgi:hypothetical protein
VVAIVGELPRPLRPTPDNLRRYHAVMGRLAARLPSLLPARFSTSFDDLAELTFVLRSRQASLGGALAHVRGRVQMTLRIVEAGGAREAEADVASEAGRGASEPSRALSAPPAAAAQPGTGYLRARATAAAHVREIAGFEPIRAAVRRWIRDERVEKRAGIASVYHLIPRSSADSYRSAAARAAAASGMRIVLSGPWPAYAFAEW